MKFTEKPWYYRWKTHIKFFFHRLRYRLFHKSWLIKIYFGKGSRSGEINWSGWDYGDIAKTANGIDILYLGNDVWKKIPPS